MFFKEAMPSAPPISVLAETEEPIPGELFSVDRLEEHAESLAAAQVISTHAGAGQPLISRVAENGRLLLEYYRATARSIQREQAITPAAQWLLDNFYIVEEQLREIRDHLPIGFYRKLPKLASGHLAGYPRVYGVAWAFVAHTDSSFDPEVLRRFVTAYQRVQPLTIGELWAVAITLRVVLIENLRRLSARMVLSHDARNEADVLADRLLGTGGQSLVSPAAVLRQFEKKPLDRAFAVQLIQRLRDLDPKVGPILLWLDERLAAQGTSADEIVRAEHQQQAAMSVTVRNIITSMRLTSAFDWHAFFESVSIVDQVLRDGSSFGAMDFATRDSYRHGIEDLSRGSDYSEVEVAERAVNRARQNAGDIRSASAHREDGRSDPGYYLISHGRLDFERELGFHVRRRRGLLRFYVRAAVQGYLGTIALLTAVILALPLARSWELGAGIPHLLLLGLLAAIPASDLAIALVNRGVTDLLGPRPLPRLEMPVIPENLRTVVVVPTLLTSKDEISEQVERLEIHYLANSDGDLRFALLSDWVDATTETLPNDEDLLAAAINGIADLNKRHGSAPGGGDRFLLFHRKRLWNESEGKWMGWERKRGKLHELNLFLRGSDKDYIHRAQRGPPESIPGVRYVITLDADTRLPRGAAARLVGTMAHPLNQPTFSADEGRVVDGYGIVQPRITPSLPGDREGSVFQRIFSGPSGIDPYSSAVSDVYQDLFREGSYTGKGIYDLDVFESALAGKVPENVLLSHDLFEGIFARAALATDIELFDEFPSNYEAAAARQHRWARGDWQLLPWIVSGRRDLRRPEIPDSHRWPLEDAGQPPPISFGTLPVFIARGRMAGTGVLSMAVDPIRARNDRDSGAHSFSGRNECASGGISKRSHFRGLASDLSLGLSQTALMVTFLGYQAWLMADAIGRTLGRLFVTHKHMLEWVTAAQAKYRVDLNLYSIFRRMVGSVVLAIAALAVVWLGHRQALFAALPFIVLWVAAPAVAHWISLPPPHADRELLSPAHARALRADSRRTWRFFETFVTTEENSLPPDNFQEDPKPVVAHRTSPTNIGLYLLSTLAARDFGWLGTLDALDRIEATLGTVGKLEQFRGHLYNWYDTRDLRPLDPKYISTVDSGNIAGHLLALASGCRELIQKSSLEPRMFAGIEDAIGLLREALARSTDTPRTHSVTRKQLSNAVDLLAASVHSAPRHAVAWGQRMFEISGRAHTVADIAQTLAQELGDAANSEVSVWSEAIKVCAQSQLRDATLFLPWLRLSSGGAAAIESRAAETSEWAAMEPFFHDNATLADAADRFDGAIRELTALRARSVDGSVLQGDQLARIDALIQAMRQSAAEAASLHRHLLTIAQRSEEMFEATDFGFLFDDTRKLFSIGYRAAEGQLDPNCYDLLASEARLASFVAIAKGDVAFVALVSVGPRLDARRTWFGPHLMVGLDV